MDDKAHVESAGRDALQYFVETRDRDIDDIGVPQPEQHVGRCERAEGDEATSGRADVRATSSGPAESECGADLTVCGSFSSAADA